MVRKFASRAVFPLMLLALAPASLAQSIHIAAIVNDDVITTNDLDDRRALIMSTNHLPDTVETQQKITPRVLDSLIGEALQMQEMKRLSIDVSDAEIASAMEKVDATRHEQAGSMAQFISEHPRLKRTIFAQLRAQLGWNKVIERKIRRNVNIAQDEITRAQVAAASAPGIPEVRIAAISIPIRNAKDDTKASKLAKDLSDQLNQGADFATLAQQMAKTHQAALNPPTWVPEAELQPAMQQALRTLQPKQITQPLRSQNSYQLITLMDRRVSKPHPDNTEVVLKQISIPLPAVKNDASMTAVRDLTRHVHDNPGSCDDTKMPDAKATATQVRAQYGQMSPDLRSVVEHLEVAGVSDPLLGDTDVKLVMLCERIEPPAALPPADAIKRKLFAEKLELEADKYLRNLRRDAFIEVKGDK